MAKLILVYLLIINADFNRANLHKRRLIGSVYQNSIQQTQAEGPETREYSSEADLPSDPPPNVSDIAEPPVEYKSSILAGAGPADERPFAEEMWTPLQPINLDASWPTPKTTRYDFQMCPNGTYLSGVSLKHALSKSSYYIVSQVRMSCSNLKGQHISDVYLGMGHVGGYGTHVRCGGPIARGMTIELSQETCHPGVINLDICDQRPKPKARKYMDFRCPNSTAPCGFSLSYDNYRDLPLIQTYTKKNCYDYFLIRGGLLTYNQFGLRCCHIEDPVDTCQVRHRWDFIQICDGTNGTCSFDTTIGFRYLTNDAPLKQLRLKNVQAAGHTLDKSYPTFKQKVLSQYGAMKFEKVKLSDVLASLERTHKRWSGAVATCKPGGAYQLVITCSIYEMATTIVRCAR